MKDISKLTGKILDAGNYSTDLLMELHFPVKYKDKLKEIANLLLLAGNMSLEIENDLVK